MSELRIEGMKVTGPYPVALPLKRGSEIFGRTATIRSPVTISTGYDWVNRGLVTIERWEYQRIATPESTSHQDWATWERCMNSGTERHHIAKWHAWHWLRLLGASEIQFEAARDGLVYDLWSPDLEIVAECGHTSVDRLRVPLMAGLCQALAIFPYFDDAPFYVFRATDEGRRWFAEDQDERQSRINRLMGRFQNTPEACSPNTRRTKRLNDLAKAKSAEKYQNAHVRVTRTAHGLSASVLSLFAPANQEERYADPS